MIETHQSHTMLYTVSSIFTKTLIEFFILTKRKRRNVNLVMIDFFGFFVRKGEKDVFGKKVDDIF